LLGFLSGFTLLAGPYCWSIGGLTVKRTSKTLLEIVDPSSSSFLFAARFQAGEGCPYALYQVLAEIVQTYLFALAVPAVLGVAWACWRCGRHARGQGGTAFVLVYGLIHLLALCRMATLVHYVSDRHTLPIVMVGTLFGAAWFFEWVDALAARFPRSVWLASPCYLNLVLGALVLVMAGRICKPLHAGQHGHLLAGRWLAEQSYEEDTLIDPYCLVTYYSGRALSKPRLDLPSPRSRFVVWCLADRDPERTAQMKPFEADGLGTQTFAWPRERPQIVVYRKRYIVETGNGTEARVHDPRPE
jgi:hypothetical protein